MEPRFLHHTALVLIQLVRIFCSKERHQEAHTKQDKTTSLELNSAICEDCKIYPTEGPHTLPSLTHISVVIESVWCVEALPNSHIPYRDGRLWILEIQLKYLLFQTRVAQLTRKKGFSHRSVHRKNSDFELAFIGAQSHCKNLAE